jgi:hypothetical protein
MGVAEVRAYWQILLRISPGRRRKADGGRDEGGAVELVIHREKCGRHNHSVG